MDEKDDLAEASRRHSEYMQRERTITADRVRQETWARQDSKDYFKNFDKRIAANKKTKAAEAAALAKQEFVEQQTEAKQAFAEEQRERRLQERRDHEVHHAKLALHIEKEKTQRSLAEISANTSSYKTKLDDDYVHDRRTRELEKSDYKFRSNVDVDAYRENRRTDTAYMRKEVNTRMNATLIEKIADHVLTKDMIRFQRGIDNRIESQSIEEIADKLDALDAAHDRHDRQSLNVEHELQLRNITEQED